MTNGKKEFPSTTIYYAIDNEEQVVFIYGYTSITDPGGINFYNQSLSIFSPKTNLYASGEMVYIDINVTADFAKEELKFEGTASWGGIAKPVNEVVKF